MPATQEAWAVSIQLEPTAVVSIARTAHCVALLGKNFVTGREATLHLVLLSLGTGLREPSTVVGR